MNEPLPGSTEAEKLARAKHKVEAIKGFYIHLTVFVLVMALLLAINLAASPIWWVHWPFMGWGIGVIAHAVAVFGHTPGAISRWEARKVNQLKDQL